jgi:lysophospholipase L1-like esterase
MSITRPGVAQFGRTSLTPTVAAVRSRISLLKRPANAAAPSFIPTQLPGLALWLKADAGTYQDAARTVPAVALNDPVGGWQDFSGAGNHVSQATAGKRMLLNTSAFNGLPGVIGAAANGTYLANTGFSALASKTGATVFVVFGSAANCTPFDAGAGLQVDSLPSIPGDQFFATTGSFSYGQNVDPAKVPKVLACRYDSTQSSDATRLAAWMSGSRSTLTLKGNAINASLQPGNGVTVGATNGGANQFVDGPVFEVVVYARALTDAEVAQVNGYLGAKWFSGLPSSVICGGDSLSVSYPANSIPGQLTYPAKLGQILGPTWYVAPSGQGAEVGATTTRIAQLAGNGADAQRQPYRPRDWYILWGGINDLQAGVDPTTVFNNLVSITQARAGYGFKVAVCTVTSRSDGPPPASFELNRHLLNNMIRTAAAPPWLFVVDIGSDPILQFAAANNDPTYSNGDGVHLNQAGYSRVATLVGNALTAYLAANP